MSDFREVLDLTEENERLRGLHSQAVDKWEAWKKRAEEYGAEIERLRDACEKRKRNWLQAEANMETAHNDALEEAVRVVEEICIDASNSRRIVAAIRELKEKP